MTVLADAGQASGLGTLIVLVLIIATVGIIYAMVHSLRRLRRNVDEGTFRGSSDEQHDDRRDDHRS
jgi:uncharacterized ion transporter superfamily protein YfcC